MASTTQENLVARQFGPRAAAYVASTVHAQGPDLDQLTALIRERPTGRVLDLGCGGGHVSFTLAPHVGEIVAYDLSAEMVEAVAQVAAQRGLHNLVAQRGAAERLPFESGAFDAVVSRYSAHHWHDFPAALKEARRVLKNDGRAVFIDGISPGIALLDTNLQAIELLRDPSHVRNYSHGEWRRALSDAGFAPGEATFRRVRLDFAAWVERIATPEIHIAAIRSLQNRMPEDVVRHLEIEADGTFKLDTMFLAADPA